MRFGFGYISKLCLCFVVIVVDLEEAIIARVKVAVKGTLGLDHLRAELASVGERAWEVRRLDVLEENTFLSLAFPTQLANIRHLLSITLFQFLHKVREIPGVALV